jgi:hypothetical protein
LIDWGKQGKNDRHIEGRIADVQIAPVDDSRYLPMRLNNHMSRVQVTVNPSSVLCGARILSRLKSAFYCELVFGIEPT